MDTLTLYIDFKDGDGDLGLGTSSADISAPYNSVNFFQEGDAVGTLRTVSTFAVTYGDTTLTQLNLVSPTSKLISYRTRNKLGYGDLPVFDPADLGCRGYTQASVIIHKSLIGVIDKSYHIRDSIIDANKEVFYAVSDTLLFEKNDNQYNIDVRFYVLEGNEYKEYSWEDNFFCSTFNSRFPVLFENDSYGSPLEGTLRYDMQSTGFLAVFSVKTLKLRVFIKDRALNHSNTIETPPFTLDKIRQ